MAFTLQSNANLIGAQMRRKASALVRGTAFGIEAHIKTAMAEEKHGATYGAHVASAPGEAPAIDTGLLVNSLQVVAQELNAVVGTNAEYAPHLEFGTTRMAPRPYFAPAFDDAAEDFKRGLRELV